jgi:hypothetical protein
MEERVQLYINKGFLLNAETFRLPRSLLQSQLGNAVNREDYEDAARLKVAIAAAASNDTVGRVMSQLNVRNLTCKYGLPKG